MADSHAQNVNAGSQMQERTDTDSIYMMFENRQIISDVTGQDGGYLWWGL